MTLKRLLAATLCHCGRIDRTYHCSWPVHLV